MPRVLAFRHALNGIAAVHVSQKLPCSDDGAGLQVPEVSSLQMLHAGITTQTQPGALASVLRAVQGFLTPDVRVVSKEISKNNQAFKSHDTRLPTNSTHRLIDGCRLQVLSMAMPLMEENKRLVSALEEALNILGAECVLLIKVSTTDCWTKYCLCAACRAVCSVKVLPNTSVCVYNK